MIYDVSRFGYYTLNSGEIHPGWQAHFVVADSPEEAMAKALPVMDAHQGFRAKDPAEVKPARCPYHPRYQAKRQPADSSTCGACHAMWRAAQEFQREGKA